MQLVQDAAQDAGALQRIVETAWQRLKVNGRAPAGPGSGSGSGSLRGRSGAVLLLRVLLLRMLLLRRLRIPASREQRQRKDEQMEPVRRAHGRSRD